MKKLQMTKFEINTLKINEIKNVCNISKEDLVIKLIFRFV